MSTIEEAREQARAALNSAAVARRYSVHPDAGTLERALRALLDATEPQETTSPAAETQLEAVTSAGWYSQHRAEWEASSCTT